MGCNNSKNTADDDKNKNQYSNQKQVDLGQSNQSHKISNPNMSNSQTIKNKKMSINDFQINHQSFITEKKDKIQNHYNLLKPALGKGSFGEVRKAIHKQTALVRAVKMILKSSASEEEIKKLLNEVQILKNLDHPNIMKIYEFFQDEKYFYIVSELCTGGELFDKIVKVKYFSELQAAEIMLQVLSAVAYCHKNQIVHRDLKPENLLLESNKDGAPIKVIDFGTARNFDPKIKMNQKFGTLMYMAPEIFQGRYDSKCDLWSCGIIAYILICGYPPFPNNMNAGEFEKNNIKLEFPDDEWKNVSQKCKSFIKKLITVDPKARISAEQAIQDEWFTEIKQNQSLQNMPLATKALSNLKTFRMDQKLQQATWSFLVSQVATKDEKNELMKTFKQLDLNGDGILTREELLIGYKKIMQEDDAEREVDKIMRNIDTNNSGSIDYSEFVSASINRQNMLSKERLEMAFKMFDIDGSGSISIQELKQLFSGGGADVTDEVWNEVIKEIDNNGDGEVSLQEFKDMMMKICQ